MNKSNLTIWSYWKDGCALLLLALLLFMQCAQAQTVPGAPTIGPAWASRGGATVAFTAPASDGGSPVTGYIVTSSPGNLTVSGTASPISIAGLTNGTKYTFTVAASNSVGTGVSSASSNPISAQPFMPTTGTVNNLVVFIRFSDQPEFSQPLSSYDSLFNSASNSLKNFYLENSYNTLTVNSTFYPAASGDTIVSYQDSNPSAYYQPYDAVTNPSGYSGLQGSTRETTLVTNALNAISALTSGLTLDGDNDGYVDHITFEVYSSTSYPNPTLFNSRATFDFSGGITLNGKKVGNYTWVSGSEGGVTATNQYAGTEIHEMGHSLGYPDLRNNGQFYPVGNYDVMSLGTSVHSGAFEKYKYTNWIQSIPIISSYGTYSINDITQSTNNSFKIPLPNSNEYLVLEYRKVAGQFESNLPGSGLCITRVNESAGKWGNSGGPPFILYYFRANGTASSDGSAGNLFTCLNAESGQTQFNDFSNPACFLSNGTSCGISIYNIGTTSGSSISFSVGDPATTVITHLIKGNISYSNGARVSGVTVTLTGDATGMVTTTGGTPNYLFTANAGGNFTITPTMANVTISPSSAMVSNLTSDQVINFTATKITHTISGTVTSSGSPLSGITMAINCSVGANYASTSVTDATGMYSFLVDAGSTCSVYNAQIGYSLTPSSPNFINVTSNQIQNFSTNPSNVTLSGKITYNGANLSGVNVSCPGSSTTTPITTDSTGTYSFTVTIGNGSAYTVTPSSASYTFSPANKVYNGIVSGQVQNFTATSNTYTLTYTAGSNGSLSGTATQTVNSNASGSAVTAVPASGYHFVSWSDASTANPRTDSNVTANLAVSASFAINTFTLGYNGNGNTGGTAPTDAGTYAQGATVTVLGNTGSLVKTGYTFAGWNTAENGSGTAQASSSTFAMGTTNVTLYAQWTLIPQANLVTGWNLIGNSVEAPLDVTTSTVLNDTNKVVSVWKWEPRGMNGLTNPAWAFYAPSLAANGTLDSYAASKGYDVLTTINGGEGFWVNAKLDFAIQLPSGVSISSSSFADQTTGNKLPAGWSLISTGDNPTPKVFANTISVTLPTDVTAATSIITLWAWDSSSMNWYFYAPSLDNAGTLASYISGKVYLNFSGSVTTQAKTLDSTTGFWVNHP